MKLVSKLTRLGRFKLKSDYLFRVDYFLFVICFSLFSPIQAQERATITLDISAKQSLAFDWDHSKNYRLQLPNDLNGNWLLSIEQQGLDVAPSLVSNLGEHEISVDIPIFTVGIERLAFSADVMNGASVDLPLVDKVTSPGGLKISLQAIRNPQLFLLFRQLMAASALLKDKDLELPNGIHCETAIDGFNQDPGRAAHCFKAARESYKPEFKTIIGTEELAYYLADSVRRQTLLSDAQRLYLPLTRQQNDLRIQALALHGLAWTVWRSGEHKVGEAFARQAVSVYELWQQRDANNRGIGYQQFSARNIACLIQHEQQQLESAERCYLDLLTEVQAASDQVTEHVLIGNLGGIYFQRGDIARARVQFNKSYDLYTRIGDVRGQALALSTIGLTERRAGNLSVALSFYQRAEKTAEKALVSRADRYRHLQAAIYLDLGDYQRARLLYQERERSAKVKGQKTIVSFVSLELAGIAKHDGRIDDARSYYAQSLDIEKELGNSSGISKVLLSLVELELDVGQLGQAGNYLVEVNSLLPQVETFRVRILAEYINGKYLLKKSEFSGAIVHLKSALNAYQTASFPYSESMVHSALVGAYRGMGQLDRAEQHAKSAISIINKIRPENISMDLRASFSSRQREAYEKLIDLYLSRWQEEKLEMWSRKALVLSEKARAQTLKEAANSSQSTAGLSSELQQQRSDLSDRLNALATLRLKAKEKQHQESVNKLDLQYTDTLVALENFNLQYLPESANRLALADLDIDKQLVALAEDSASLVTYLSEEAGVLWVLAAGQLKTYNLPANNQIETQVQSILTALRRPGGHQLVKKELLSLGRVLDPGLPAGVTTIRLTLDGILNYLPFAALAVKGDEQSYWLQRFNIINSPFIADLPAQGTSQSADWKSLSILADPEYDQSKIKAVTSEIATTYPHELGLYRLRGSAVEAKTIAEIAQLNLPERTDVEILSGSNVTRIEVLEGKVTNADILHFATHGIFDNQGIALAGLALSVVDNQGIEQPWLLTAQELYQTPIASRLVVMSACDTGTGALAAGEGLMGMVRAFMYAGVTDVVSSQWKVSDRAAVELMRSFYTALLEQNHSVSAALRQAQLSFVQSDSYSDPFYWAGFSDFQQ